MHIVPSSKSTGSRGTNVTRMYVATSSFNYFRAGRVIIFTEEHWRV